MSGVRTARRASLVVALLASLATGALAPRAASAGWWDEAMKARETTLDDLRAAPERWRDVPVSLVVRFVRGTERAPAADGAASEWRGLSVTSVPVTLATTGDAPVTTTSDAPVAAADAAQQGPDASKAASPVPFDAFVVRRGSAEDARLAALRAGDEIRVRAVVRDAATVEIVWISGAADAMTPEELAALARADVLMKRDNAAGAEALYRELLDGRELAPAICAHLWRRIAGACREQRKLSAAATAYCNALRIDPEDRASRADLAAVDEAVHRAAAAAAAGAAFTDASGRAWRPLPELNGVAIPVPAVPLRLAGPKDDAPAGTTPRTEPKGPAAAPPAAPVASPAAQPAAPAAPVPPPPPTRLAPPK